MQFTPRTEEDLQSEANERSEANLLPKGEYEYEITYAEDRVSKKGNDMIELRVNVFGPEGNIRLVYDYLMESMGFKLRHAAYSCGLGQKYEDADLRGDDFTGRTGRCLVKIQPAKDGYGPKNVIEDYVVVKETATPEQIKEELADEIPF